MREKRMRRVFVWFLLLALIVGQGNMAFAAKPIKPPPEPSSTLDITTSDFNLTVPENQTIEFTINASTKEEYAIIWGTTTSDYGLLNLTEATPPVAKPGKKVTAYLQEATFLFKPSNVDSDQTAVFTITAVKPDDSINKDQITVTITVTPVETQVPFVYVALGDSIPAGVSYEYNQTGGIIESYTDKMNIYLSNQYENVVYHDKTISGMNIYLDPIRNPTNELTLYDQIMYDVGIREYINSADLITLCIGANDIMDAARRKIANLILFKFEYIDFYDIDWITADVGRLAFENHWPIIIDEIRSINSEVELMVMTVYNPYNFSDKGSYNIGVGQDPNLYIHDQVDLYLSGTSESSRGINTIIRNYEFDNDYSPNYKVVDVHSYFESNYKEAKGAVTGFYGLSPILGVPIKDPHPDITGQTEIYNLHFDAYQQMN